MPPRLRRGGRSRVGLVLGLAMLGFGGAVGAMTLGVLPTPAPLAGLLQGISGAPSTAGDGVDGETADVAAAGEGSSEPEDAGGAGETAGETTAHGSSGSGDTTADDGDGTTGAQGTGSTTGGTAGVDETGTTGAGDTGAETMGSTGSTGSTASPSPEPSPRPRPRGPVDMSLVVEASGRYAHTELGPMTSFGGARRHCRELRRQRYANLDRWTVPTTGWLLRFYRKLPPVNMWTSTKAEDDSGGREIVHMVDGTIENGGADAKARVVCVSRK